MQTLQLHSQGSDVLTLTQFLVKYKYLLNTSSVFDQDVLDAVRVFQASNVDPRGNPLTPDGVVGPLTWWALQNDDLTQHFATPSVAAYVAAAQAAVVENMVPNSKKYGDVVLRMAFQEIAAGAQEIGGDNMGPFVQKYLNGLSPQGVSWCAAFVSWCHQQASKLLSVPMPYHYTLGAIDTYHQFQKKGWTYTASSSNPPQTGDIIIWTRGSPGSGLGHVGLVSHYTNGLVYTIEGNKGPVPARVSVFCYTLSHIANLYGFGRIS